MEESNQNDASKTDIKRFGCLQVFGLIVIAIILAVGITFFVFKTYFFPSEFKPVSLKPHEEQVLTAKVENFASIGYLKDSQTRNATDKSSQSDRFDSNSTLKPEPYSEEGLKREINFTEREINALLAKNTDLASKVAIDLSDNLISAKVLLPMDEDFPILGGKILRFKAGVVFAYGKGKPVVILKGVTIMGVPIPNAWIGGIKNVDIIEEYGTNKGFWKSFSDGVEDIRVKEGLLQITLKE